MKQARIPAVIVLEGWQAAGKGDVLNRILQPLDPRGFRVWNVHHSTELELMFPTLRRFWLNLPRKGTIGIFNHSWYRLILDASIDTNRIPVPDNLIDRIRAFERQLTDYGAVILKFFFHITREEQAKRFDKLEKDPAYSWKVGKDERRQNKRYKTYAAKFDQIVEGSHHEAAPWCLVPSTDWRYATVQMSEAIAAAFEAAVEGKRGDAPTPSTAPPKPVTARPLEAVDLSAAVDDDSYDKQLPRLQKRLRRLQHVCYRQRVPVVLVYEGWDAAGKGGNIRRLTRDLDPRGYHVYGIGAPEGEERDQHYLWRFWRGVPKAGHFAIFDRSWYGRVLVERVEGFATAEEWQRSYDEINDFERELTEDGAIICKFWIHISSEEQLARFEARQRTPHKRWKITEDDWRNREKWDAYYEAATEMIARTSTKAAPWTVVAGNDKRHARLTALRTVNKRVAAALAQRKKD
jgi:polyphosphate:AMP phosphotransferase